MSYHNPTQQRRRGFAAAPPSKHNAPTHFKRHSTKQHITPFCKFAAHPTTISFPPKPLEPTNTLSRRRSLGLASAVQLPTQEDRELVWRKIADRPTPVDPFRRTPVDPTQPIRRPWPHRRSIWSTLVSISTSTFSSVMSLAAWAAPWAISTVGFARTAVVLALTWVAALLIDLHAFCLSSVSGLVTKATNYYDYSGIRRLVHLSKRAAGSTATTTTNPTSSLSPSPSPSMSTSTSPTPTLSPHPEAALAPVPATNPTLLRGRGARAIVDTTPPPPNAPVHAPPPPVKVEIQARFGVGHPQPDHPMLQSFAWEGPLAQDEEVLRRYKEAVEDGLPPSGFVDHRFTWEGPMERLAETMKAAPFMLTSLKIVNGGVGVQDVLAILGAFPGLETLEVATIMKDAHDVNMHPVFPPALIPEGVLVHPGLKFLTIASDVSLNWLFNRLELPSIHTLAMKFEAQGNNTSLENLFQQSSRIMGSSWRIFKLRGEIDPEILEEWKEEYSRFQLALDLTHACAYTKRRDVRRR